MIARTGLAARRWSVYPVIAVLAALAAIPYLPFTALPLISDDYIQVGLARQWGPVSGWPELAGDALYRCRATSLVLTYWTDRIFGAESAVFQAQSIVLHVVATLLLAAFGWWHRIGWRLSAVSAAFFAIHEGHQEAVVWYAALPELLVFLFGLLTLHCWIWWSEGRRWASLAYCGALAFFLLALLSKESSVAAVGLMAGVCLWTRVPVRRAALSLAPFLAVSVVYASLIFLAKKDHLHLNDGTFSLHAPVAEVAIRSLGRLLWVWGVPAVAVLWWRRRSEGWLLVVASFWMLVTILPYSFLTYMPRVPSRHVYWASAGLALLIGGAFLALWQQGGSRWRLAAIGALMIVQNVGWLWYKKFPQYVRRAEPTEAFLRYASGIDGPILIKCFPYGMEVAEKAIDIRLGGSVETVWAPDAAEGQGVYCDPSRP